MQLGGPCLLAKNPSRAWRQDPAGEAWSRGHGRSQSCRQPVIGAEGWAKSGIGRGRPGGRGPALPVSRPRLRQEQRRRRRVGGAIEGRGLCLQWAGPAAERGAVPAKSPLRAAARRLTSSVTAPAPVSAALAPSRSRRGLRRSPSPVPRLRAHIRGRPGSLSLRRPHLELIWNCPPGRPRWSPRPIWPGRAGSLARSWSLLWTRGPGAPSCAAGAW